MDVCGIKEDSSGDMTCGLEGVASFVGSTEVDGLEVLRDRVDLVHRIGTLCF